MNQVTPALIYAYFDTCYTPLLADAAGQDPAPAASAAARTHLWQYWGQGAEAAPPLVRACLASVSRHCGDCEIHVLDDRTLHDYVTIPPHILQRLDSGAMDRTHFSDYLRTCLLLQYGGIWLDASVYLSGPLPAAMREAAFFIYQSPLFHSFASLPPFVSRPHLSPPPGTAFPPPYLLCGSNWCIAAACGCRLPLLLRRLLEAYWQRNNRLLDYFLFHYLMTWLLYRDRGCAELFLSMPSLSNIPPHLMQAQLPRPYNPQLDAAIRAATSVHKLTYKLETAPGATGLTLHHLLCGA